MEKIWYYAVDGERYGPVTFAALRDLVMTGKLGDLDLIWQPSFGPEWRNIGQVRGLFASAIPEQPDTRPALDTGIPPLAGVTGEQPSAWLAVSQAFNRMVMLLFRPFDIIRWFSIGFCAWLAYIGTPNSFNYQGGNPSSIEIKPQVDLLLDKLVEWPADPAKLQIMVFTGFVLLLLALWMCFLRSRGDFMFLHRWYVPDTPIRECWMASRAAGQALFTWRIAFFIIVFLLFSLIASYSYGMIIKPYLAAGKVWDGTLLKPATGCLTATILLMTGSTLVSHAAKAFVVPLVYWNGISISRAWGVVFALINQYPFAVIGYLSYGIISAVLAGLALLSFGLMTCCIGFIPMVLPYVSSVFLLPYTFFFRGYPVCFLHQWRSDLVPIKDGKW